MNIKRILSITIALILISATFAGCRKVGGDDMSSGNVSNLSSAVYDVVDIVENESSEAQSSTESTVSDDTQSDVSSNVVSSDIFTENVVSVGDNNNEAEPDAPLTFIESESDSETTTDTSKGYDKVTCDTSPNTKTGNVVTVPIAANGSVYYKIKGASNKILTLENADAYVVYNGTKYLPKNGIISFTVVSNELASAQILFEIGNNGSEAQSFTINFSSPKGSRDNPEVINSIDNNITVNIAEGNEQGYFYEYTATQSGKIRFYILSDAKSGKLSVDKIINAKLQVVQQRNTTETGEDYVKTDEIGTYIEFDVTEGDEFDITVSPNSNPGVYPAVTVVWKIVYN